AGEHGDLPVETNLCPALGHRLVVRRTGHHVGDVLGLVLGLAAAVDVNQVVGEILLEQRLVLCDRAVPPAPARLAHTVGRFSRLQQAPGHDQSDNHQELPHAILPSTFDPRLSTLDHRPLTVRPSTFDHCGHEGTNARRSLKFFFVSSSLRGICGRANLLSLSPAIAAPYGFPLTLDPRPSTADLPQHLPPQLSDP